MIDYIKFKKINKREEVVGRKANSMLLVIKEKFDCVYEVFLSVISGFMATSMETRLNNSFPRKIRSTDDKLWFQHSV